MTPSYNPDFPAAGNVLAGDTVNGLAGTLTLPAAGKVLTSTQYGAGGNGTTGSLTLPAASAVRTGSGTYGDPGAPMTPSYSPDFPSVANVLSSDTVDGDAGTLTLPAAGDVYSGVLYGAGGHGSTGALTLPTAANVRTGQGAFGRSGNSVTPTLADCTADGEQDCVANSTYAAADVSGLAAKVAFGATVAGVSGSVHVPATSSVLDGVSVGVSDTGTVVLPAPSDVRLAVSFGASSTLTGTLDPGAGLPGNCSSDGETNCIAVTSYPAVDKTNLASKVLSTASVAGVAGNVILPATGKVLASTGYGVSGTGRIGTLTLPPANKVLASSGSYGDPGAPMTPAYSPDFPATGNVLAGDTVDGAPGTLTLPPATSVLASVGPYGVGGNGSTPSLTLPATGKVLASTQYGVGGSGSTGALTLPAAGNVLSGTGIYGDPAAAATPSYNPDFPAAGNVLAGDTVNGMAGTLTLPAAGKVLASTQYGEGGNGTTGSLTLPAASAVRTGSGTYGDPGAPLTPSYSPDFPAVANVLSSDTVDGDAGTLTLPAAGDVYSGVLYGAGGHGSTGALTLPTAANVRTGQGAFGRSGSSVTPTLADCSADGATGCVTSASFKSASMAVAKADNIRSGVTIAGVPGGYPSATYPLTGAGATTDLVSLSASVAAGGYEWWASDGTRYAGSIADAGTITPSATTITYTGSVYRQFTVAGDVDLTSAKIKAGVNLFGVTGAYPSSTYPLSGADSTPDLDLATFDARIKSADDFEWFDSSGTRYVNAGDTDINEKYIVDGVTIFGTTGTTAAAPGPCTGDGQTDCTTTTTYKSVDTSALSRWDIRSGKSAGGIAGSLVFYKNHANTSRYNRTSGTGSSSSLDIYDTIDDANNNGTFPTQNPGGWPQLTGENWTRDSVSDNGAGGGAADDGVCSGSEDCVYKDEITALYWAKDDGATRNWESAITYCENKTYGSYSDWRLPTQKELSQAYNDGIWSLRSTFNLVTSYYWSSTTRSDSLNDAWFQYLVRGSTLSNPKGNSYNMLCVRP